MSLVNLKIHLFTTDIAFILYIVFVAHSKEIKLIHNYYCYCMLREIIASALPTCKQLYSYLNSDIYNVNSSCVRKQKEHFWFIRFYSYFVLFSFWKSKCRKNSLITCFYQLHRKSSMLEIPVNVSNNYLLLKEMLSKGCTVCRFYHEPIAPIQCLQNITPIRAHPIYFHFYL